MIKLCGHRNSLNGIVRGVRGALVALLGLTIGLPAAFCAGSGRVGRDRPDGGPIYEFLVRNGVPIYEKVRLARVSAVLQTSRKVRSVVKVISPERLPGQRHLEEIRKRIRSQMRRGLPINLKLDTSKIPSELDLLRDNILAGEVIEFHPSEKLGELELFFSQNRSLKIEIGYDMFYIRIGKNDCTFRSPSLRRQLKNILKPRKVNVGGRLENWGGGSGSPRETARQDSE